MGENDADKEREATIKKVEELRQSLDPVPSSDPLPDASDQSAPEQWGRQLGDRLVILLIIAVALYMLLSNL